MRSRLLVLPAAAVLGFGAATGVAACGDDETETVTQIQSVTQTATTETAPTGTSTGGGQTGGGGGGSSEFEQCVKQTGNPDFCANPPPGE